ncbi:MAG: MATE family efflux transporter [Spirochaetales bacterium]|nr:MATE family efflux transporter [Spirochaetales bacterium]
MSKRTDLLEHGSIGKALITLSIPSILAMFMNAIYNLVDAVFIGMLDDTAALAAISLIFPVFMVIGAIGLGFGIGGASAASRFLGEKNLDRAQKIVSTAFFLSLISAIVFFILGQIFTIPFLRAMNAEGDVFGYSVSYARIVLFGGIFQILNMTMNNIIRSEGAAIYSGIAISSGAILNMILDPLFIFGFNMGVSGAAVATAVGQIVAFFIAISFFFSKKSLLKIKLKSFSREARDFLEILKIGTPTFIRQVLTGVSTFVMLGLITTYGDEALAAVGAIVRLIMFASFVIFGYAHAFQPVAGYNFGAMRFPRMYKALRISLVSTSIYSLVMTIIMLLFPKALIMMFSRDPEVVEMGALALRVFAISFPFLGFQVMYSTFFQAIGYGMASFVSAVARQGVFLIPLLYILEHFYQLKGVVLSQPIADYLTLGLTIFIAIYVHRKLAEKERYHLECCSDGVVVEDSIL